MKLKPHQIGIVVGLLLAGALAVMTIIDQKTRLEIAASQPDTVERSK